MTRRINKLFFLSIVFSSCSGNGETINDVVAGVIERAHNVSHKISKKTYSKSPIEFKQAVDWYIKNTENTCMHGIPQTVGKLPSYEVELHYLFNNYTKFSNSSLLSRLRSAHQAFIKNNIDLESDRAERFEQISSALMLTSAQVCADNARQQLLDALHEVDDLSVYWRTQQNHWVKYFFHKSPIKWIVGKRQEREVWDNIRKLEYKQAELYTTLGKLTAHMHSFTDCGAGYADCYDWVEELFSVLSCIPTPAEKVVDETRFDRIAAILELKIKNVGYVKYNSLLPVASAKKSNHFVRHWIAYTAALAAVGYTAHYYAHNQDEINNWIGLEACRGYFNALKASGKRFVVTPINDVFTAIFCEDKPNSVATVTLRPDGTVEAVALKPEQYVTKLEAEMLIQKGRLEVQGLVEKADIETTRVAMAELFEKLIADSKLTQEQADVIAAAELQGNIVPFQELFNSMDKKLVGNLVQRDEVLNAFVIFAELKIYHYGVDPIHVVMELIVEYGLPLVREVFSILAKGNSEWAAVSKKLSLILNVVVLTPTIITGWMSYNGLSRAYQLITARDYSSMRIALADVNSLLIESHMPLDNHDYGKLVYLAHKLRNKAVALKDALSDEFLADIKKLESKQFDVATKRGIVDNMFNKYGFLGRVAA